MTDARIPESPVTSYKTVLKSVLRRLAVVVAILLIAWVLLGFSGRYLALGDSAAVIRPQVGAFLIPWAALLWVMKARRFAFASLAAATLAIGSVAPGFFANVGKRCVDDCLTIYQKNLLSQAWPRHQLADDIIASGAEIVTLQEVSSHNRHYMVNIYEHYGFSVICKFRPGQDVAVLTSLPVVEGSEFCLPGTGLAGVQVQLPNGKSAWALSIHFPWPFPFDQYDQSQMIANKIAGLEGPKLIGGDFNMVPWGGSMHRIKEASGTRYLGAYRNTYALGSRWLPLHIDNVLVPEHTTGRARLRPNAGSDHRGILARFTLP